MSIKLILNVGDRVRNIGFSSRNGWIGMVSSSKGGKYTVNYQGFDVRQQEYYKDTAHLYLEKIDEPAKSSDGVPGGYPWDFSRQEQKNLAIMYTYGAGMERLHDYAQRRTVLNKVRRNVITGKTQDEMVKEYGHAVGVSYFNTRATGRSTGLAFRIVGDAMCNPGKLISYRDVDHVFHEGTKTPHRDNDSFFKTICDVIGDKKGFTFNRQECTVMFNPIVTEETYVTRSN